MQKHLIVVFGPANTGKTTSIKEFENELGKELTPLKFDRETIGWMSIDIRVKYTLKDKDINIGIFSSGDACCNVNGTLNKYFSDCMIIVCAARSCRTHIDNILKFADTNKYTVIPLFKMRATNEDNARIEKEMKIQLKKAFPFSIFNADV